MKRVGYILMLMAFLVPAGLTGCSYESRETTVHKPGVYKGAKDDLLARQHRQELIDRFKLVQADR
jgi:hypothetical protein